MRRAHIAWGILIVLVCVGAKNFVETGLPRMEEFKLAEGQAVTVSDSIPEWERVEFVIVENLGAAAAEFGIFTAAGWVEMGIEGARLLNLPIAFEDNSVITSDASRPDTVIKAVAGSLRVYPSGG